MRRWLFCSSRSGPDTVLQVLTFIEAEQRWCVLAALLVRSLQGNRLPIHYNLIVSGKPEWPPANLTRAPHCLMAFDRPFGRYPTLNKLVMMRAAREADHHLLLDHDIVCVTPAAITGYLGTAVCAAPNLKVGAERAFGPRLEALSRIVTGRCWEKVNYYNAGVVIVPTAHVAELRENWISAAHAVCDAFEPDIDTRPMPIGNLSFSLALAASGIPAASLPDRMNQRDWGYLPVDPVLLHYNNFDAANRDLKAHAHSVGALRNLIEASESRWWRTYARLILPLLDAQTQGLAEEMWHRIVRTQLAEER